MSASQHELRSYRAKDSNVLLEQRMSYMRIIVMYSDITKKQYKIYKCMLCGSIFLTSNDALAHEEYEEQKFAKVYGVSR